MQFGDMQSVLQVLVALNLAYFSFREIRAPAFTRYLKKYKSVKEALIETRAILSEIDKPDRLIFGDEASSLYNKRYMNEATLDMHSRNLELLEDPFSDNFHAFDRGIRFASIFIAGLDFILLYLASVYSKTNVEAIWFFMITIVSISPILASIYYHYTIANLLRDQTNQQLESIRQEIKEIKDKFLDEFLPRYYEIMNREVQR